jgi:hypothetical protein
MPKAPPSPTIPKGKLTAFPSSSSPNLSHLVTSPNLSRSGSLLRIGQAVGMARNPSAQTLDHGVGRHSRDSGRTVATAERLSWSLFDDKIGPFGTMASLGSQSAWEGQMEGVLKVPDQISRLTNRIYMSQSRLPLCNKLSLFPPQAMRIPLPTQTQNPMSI